MSSTKFYFRPAQNEQIETTVHMKPDSRCAVQGHVKGAAGEALPDALVLLFESREGETPSLIAQSYTDEFGLFMFGPLVPDKLYLIKVYKNFVKIRELEITPEE